MCIRDSNSGAGQGKITEYPGKQPEKRPCATVGEQPDAHRRRYKQQWRPAEGKPRHDNPLYQVDVYKRQA